MRRKIGRGPRRFDGSARGYHRIRPPAWCDRRERLREIYDKQEELFTNGELVWGVLVQANSLLFEPGREDCPAMALYGLDTDDEVWALREIASGLFDLKDKYDASPKLREFQRVITDEMARPMKLRVPEPTARGFEIYATSIMVHRKHLPQGVLAGNTFPLLRSDHCDPTIILPSRYWSDRLLLEWGERVGPTA